MLDVMMDQISQVAGLFIPQIAGALGILIVGWLIALIVAALLRALMRRTGLAQRVAAWFAGEEGTRDVHVDKWVGRGAYYLIMLFVLVAVFQTLGLTLLTEPLNRLLTRIFEFAPRILGAGLLLIIAWVLASVLRLVIAKVLTAAKLDERLRGGIGEGDEQRPPLARSLADAVYWLIFLLFLPGVLNALAVEGLLEPIQAMVGKVAGFIPNLFTAAVILGVGWFVARIVQRVVSSLLSAVGLDALSEKGGLSAVLGTQRLSAVVGLVAYILIFLPVGHRRPQRPPDGSHHGAGQQHAHHDPGSHSGYFWRRAGVDDRLSGGSGGLGTGGQPVGPGPASTASWPSWVSARKPTTDPGPPRLSSGL